MHSKFTRPGNISNSQKGTVVVCIVRATERQKTGLSRNKTHHRVTRTYNIANSTNPQIIARVYNIARFYNIGRLSDGYRTVKVIADTSDLQYRTVIGNLSDG